MKDNLNIEKLFKDKFENFEGNVNPNLWNNISNGIASSSVTTTGIGVGLKALIISTSVAVVGVTTYFIGGFNETPNQIVKQNTQPIHTVEQNTETIQKNNTPSLVIIAENNDPVITKNETEILKVLSKNNNLNTDKQTLNNNTELIITPQITSKNNSNLGVVNNVSTDNSVTIEEDKKVSQNVASESAIEPIIPKGKIEFVSNSNLFEYSFKANVQDAIKIEWNFGDGYMSTDENPKHIYNAAGDYKVSLTLVSEDNHIYQESRIIKIMSLSSIDNIPNVITPNGDRINDEFIIKSTNIETFTIVINNQMGKKIYESNDKNFSWDGTDMNGTRVVNAVYIYYILATGSDGTILKIPGQIYVR